MARSLGEKDTFILVDNNRKSGQRYYRPELDALRFFAFLWVFLLHTKEFVVMDPVKHLFAVRIREAGGYGVSVFFLLSAFLISELLFREKERTGRIHIQSFYMRRILRIWPLYFLVFFGLAALNRFIPGVGTDSPQAWLAFSFLVGNWYIFHHGWIAGPVDPLWSISIEEQFYLVIPFIAAMGGRRAVTFISLILLVVSYVAVGFYGVFPNAVAEWTNSLVQFQFFCAGTLIAILLRGRLVKLSMLSRIGGFTAGFSCGLVASIVNSETSHPSAVVSTMGWLLVLTGTVLIFLSTLGTDSRLVPSWLSYLGRISYGLYLVHSLMLFLVFKVEGARLGRVTRSPSLRGCLGICIALLLSILTAHLLYVHFEGLFLRLKQRFTFVASRD